MRLQSVDKIDDEISKKCIKYIQEIFNGFQEAGKTKYENEKILKQKLPLNIGKSLKKKAKELDVDLIGYITIL